MNLFSRHQLSPMEIRVCELLMQGMTVQQIAQHIYRAPKTVYTLRSRAYRKLGVKNGVQLLLAYQDTPAEIHRGAPSLRSAAVSLNGYGR